MYLNLGGKNLKNREGSRKEKDYIIYIVWKIRLGEILKEVTKGKGQLLFLIREGSRGILRFLIRKLFQ